MRTSQILAVAATLALVACGQTGYFRAFPPAAPAEPPSFGTADESEYAAFRGTGSATVAGQAFLMTRGGEVRAAGGEPVTLDPATSLARAWCNQVCQESGWRKNDIADSLFLSMRRTVTANAEGRFAFTNIPPGKYLLRTGVIWWVGDRSQGGMLAELVDVPDTGRVEVIMSRQWNPYTRAR